MKVTTKSVETSASSRRSFIRTGRHFACAAAFAALGARPATAQRADSIDVRAGQRARLQAATIPASGVFAGGLLVGGVAAAGGVGSLACVDCSQADARRPVTLIATVGALLGAYAGAVLATRGLDEVWVPGRVRHRP
jgi:hypothetical protein